jgi:hypothetical protein
VLFRSKVMAETYLLADAPKAYQRVVKCPSHAIFDNVTVPSR